MGGGLTEMRSMPARSFIDTNILVYTDDHDAPGKQKQSLDLIESLRLAGNGVISTQVLQEYFVTATRKLGVPADIARRKVELFAHFHMAQIGLSTILGAIDLHRLHSFTFWDSLVVRSALDSACSELITEDLQHSRRINGLQIVNPFM